MKALCPKCGGPLLLCCREYNYYDIHTIHEDGTIDLNGINDTIPDDDFPARFSCPPCAEEYSLDKETGTFTVVPDEDA